MRTGINTGWANRNAWTVWVNNLGPYQTCKRVPEFGFEATFPKKYFIDLDNNGPYVPHEKWVTKINDSNCNSRSYEELCNYLLADENNTYDISVDYSNYIDESIKPISAKEAFNEALILSREE